MITLSKIVVIGILELFAVMLIAVLALLYINHRSHVQRAELSSKLKNLSASADSKQQPLETDTLATQTYEQFLELATEAARLEVEDYLEPDAKFNRNHSSTEKAALLRYLVLKAELAGEQAGSTESGIDTRQKRIKKLLKDLALVQSATKEAVANPPEPAKNTPPLAPDTESQPIDENDMKQKWGYLCDAAISVVTKRTQQAEEDFVELMKVINADLNLLEIDIPAQEYSRIDFETVHRESEKHRDAISALLSAEASTEETQVKTADLERMHELLKRSDWCISQLEQDLAAERGDSTEFQDTAEDSDDIPELQSRVKGLREERDELLRCVENLEEENALLKNRQGLE